MGAKSTDIISLEIANIFGIRVFSLDDLPAMSAHDLHDESSLMGHSGTGDSVDTFDNPMQGRIRTDSHVGAAEVIVD